MLAPNQWSVSSGTKPFPYYVIDNFLDTDFAKKLSEEFPNYHDQNLRPYSNPLEEKKLQNYWDHFKYHTYSFIHYLNSPVFIDTYITPLVGVPNLLPDGGLNGAGQFLHIKGGKLNPHLDYRIHPKLGLERRFSFLIYLTPGWDVSWGGDLVFYSGNEKSLCEQKTLPCLFNRAVIFDTTCNSWHGVPEPLSCPDGVIRKAIGVFYLSKIRKGTPQSFKARYALLGKDRHDPALVSFVEQRSDPNLCRSTYESNTM